MRGRHHHDGAPPTELELGEIARRVRAHAGLTPPAWVLIARLRDRMEALGCVSPADYLSRLEGAELVALTECLRVGETSFFRHQAHILALSRVVIPDLALRHQKDRKVRAWSAGCATGEEAYTLAMLLAEAMPLHEWDVKVSATDISAEALAVARAGVYPPAAVERIPEPLRKRWFVPSGSPGSVAVAVSPELKALVQLERRNLVDMTYPRSVDVILCRNVLIYFDAELRAATVEKLIESLAPGGYLFVGYSESLRAFANLEAVSGVDGIVYRRPLGPRAATPPPPPRAATPPAPPTTTTTTTPPPRRRRRTSSRMRAMPPGGVAPTPSPPGNPIVTLTGAHDDVTEIAARLSAAIARAHTAVIVDLDAAEFLADDVAAVFRRAAAAARAAGLVFELRAQRTGPRRWLARHHLESA